jgi:hypothetical protein
MTHPSLLAQKRSVGILLYFDIQFVGAFLSIRLKTFEFEFFKT